MRRILKAGDRVKVFRQIGKNGPKQEVSGTIIRISMTLRVNGEPTAYVRYDDGKSPYAHAISKCQFIEQQTKL